MGQKGGRKLVEGEWPFRNGERDLLPEMSGGHLNFLVLGVDSVQDVTLVRVTGFRDRHLALLVCPTQLVDHRQLILGCTPGERGRGKA